MSGRDPRRIPYPPSEDLPPRRPGPLVRLWRRRTEILVLACLAPLAVAVVTAVASGVWWVPALVGGTVLAVAVPRPSRDWFAMRLWCVISRRRLQRLFTELPLHTRTGRLPLVLWITPTREGEKALVLCRAGVSADAFAAYTAEFEAACSATRVRFAKHARRPQLVTIDIVRRAPRPGASAPGLEAVYGYNWVPLEPDAKEPPDRWGTVIPLPERAPRRAEPFGGSLAG